MKKISIKARVTLWYAGLLFLQLVLVVVCLLSVSGQLSNFHLREQLLNDVSDIVKAVQFDEHGELDDEKIDFYHDGVSIFLYDTGGHLLAPKVSLGIQIDSILEDGAVKTVDSLGERWLLYDLYAEKDGVYFWVRGAASLTSTIETLRLLFLLALVGVPTFVLIASLGGWQITKRAFAPVGAMAQTADAITSGNDLSLRVPDDGSGDELSLISSTVNHMLERLQSSFENEKHFSSDVSHELRTPTAIIVSQCEFALSEKAGEADKTQALESSLRQAKRISSIISQLLLLARAEDGRFQPTWELVDFSMLCEMTVLERMEKAETAGVTLRHTLAPNILLTGDETLLLRLTDNLLTNAIQYNKVGGTVTVELIKTDDTCILTVLDTGIGMRHEDIKKIWNRFYRADPSRGGNGSGLGLSMVKWIVELHNGRVEVQSEYKKGSQFRVELPLKQPTGI